jgi:hypothetical protein
VDPPVIRTRPSDRRVAVADWREAVIAGTAELPELDGFEVWRGA